MICTIVMRATHSARADWSQEQGSQDKKDGRLALMKQCIVHIQLSPLPAASIHKFSAG